LKGLWNGIVAGAEAVWNWLKALPQNIWNFMKDAQNWEVTTGRNILKGLWNGIVAAADAVWNWFKALPGEIWGFLKDAGTWLLDVGKNIIDGLINGIKNAAGAIWNTIKSIGSSIVSGFKSAMGIGSPSKLMASEVGQYVTQGIAQGMMQGVTSVHSAISSIGNTITRGDYGTAGTNFALGAGGGVSSGAGSFGGQGIQITIQMNTSDVQNWLQTGTLRYNLRNPTNGLSLSGRGSS
jgi:phage-related protein